MLMKFIHMYTILILSFGLWFSGCGQAEYSLEDVDPTSQGKFLDEAVEGLEYRRTSGEPALTLDGGFFEYKSRDKMEFYVGSLKLGESAASEVITPRELAHDATVIEDAEVNNRIRFFLALDSDPDRIGIQISQDTRVRAQSWERSMDFSLSGLAFTNEVQRVIKGPTSELPSPLVSVSTANEHFAKTLRCAYSGGYDGYWVSNESNATFGFVGAMIQATGPVLMMGSVQDENNEAVSVVYIYGEHNINTKKFSFDTTNSIAYYFDPNVGKLSPVQGSFIAGSGVNKTYNYTKGEFVNSSNGETVFGGFVLNRADALANAAYRYTGYGYPLSSVVGAENSEDILGMIIFDIDVTGNVSGMIHDVRNPFEQPQLHGQVDFDSGEVIIVIESTPKAVLKGVIDFDNTTGDTVINWYPDILDAQPFGYVAVTGCQLQAIN